MLADGDRVTSICKKMQIHARAAPAQRSFARGSPNIEFVWINKCPGGTPTQPQPRADPDFANRVNK